MSKNQIQDQGDTANKTPLASREKLGTVKKDEQKSKNGRRLSKASDKSAKDSLNKSLSEIKSNKSEGNEEPDAQRKQIFNL